MSRPFGRVYGRVSGQGGSRTLNHCLQGSCDPVSPQAHQSTDVSPVSPIGRQTHWILFCTAAFKSILAPLEVAIETARPAVRFETTDDVLLHHHLRELAVGVEPTWTGLQNQGITDLPSQHERLAQESNPERPR